MSQWNNDRWSRVSGVIFLDTPHASSEDSNAYKATSRFLGKYVFAPWRTFTQRILQDLNGISNDFREKAAESTNQTLFLCISREEVPARLFGLRIGKVSRSEVFLSE